MPNLPNETREKRVVATGPNQGFSVRGLTGFFTDAEKLSFGVNVQGNECGVYGESVNTTPQTNRRVPEDRIGVCGVGDNYGVLGKGITKAGVRGEKDSRGIGVFGVAVGDAIGVAGISKVKNPRDKKKSTGNGIVGATEGGEGFGVVGLGLDSLEPTDEPELAPRVRRDKGKFVFGQTLGGAIGVLGASGTGTGVHGLSSEARGGVFESGVGAQVNLKPLFGKSVPSFDGEAGDLVVIVKEKEPTGEFAELWLCLRGKFHGESAVWGKVEISTTFQVPHP